jgi:starch synthase
VVRATGGLDDTIEPYDPATGKGNGFKFREYTAPAMLAAVRAALDVYQNRAQWRQLMKNGMAQDFSWGRAVPKYEQIYQKVLKPISLINGGSPEAGGSASPKGSANLRV